MKQFTRLSLFSTLATYLLIFTGGIVRVSGAGLGCPEWPKCFGRWLPPTSLSQLPPEIDPSQFNMTLAWIEYTNRIIGMAVGLLILATAIFALVRFRRELRILIPSLAAAVLVAFEGWQGGVVVATELQPLLVSAHLLVSFVIVSLLIYVTIQSYYREHADENNVSEYPQSASIWVGLLWLGALVQVIIGTNVRSGLEILSERLPLLSSSLLLSQFGILDDIHLIFGIGLLLFTIIVGGAILKMSKNPSLLVRRTVGLMIILIAVQSAIGFVFVSAGLIGLMQIFHLWIAGLYVGLVLVLYAGVRFTRGLPVKSQRSIMTLIVSVVVVVAFMGIGAQVVLSSADASRADIDVYGNVPQFTYVDQDGEPFGLENMKGKISVVDFIFTNCKMACPMMATQMKLLYDRYGDSKNVQFVSISVDPERDSIPRLREYADQLGVVDRQWVFLRADIDSVRQLAEKGFMVSGDFPGGHSTKFILVDPTGQIRGYYEYNNAAELDLLKLHIREMAREFLWK